MGGSVAIVVGLFFEFGSLFSFLLLGVGIAGVCVGAYYMTRGFSKLDVDHPDYERYQELEKERKRQQGME